MLMFNFAHEGHAHVEGAPHVSGGVSTVAILIAIAIVVVTVSIFLVLRSRK